MLLDLLSMKILMFIRSSAFSLDVKKKMNIYELECFEEKRIKTFSMWCIATSKCRSNFLKRGTKVFIILENIRIQRNLFITFKLKTC